MAKERPSIAELEDMIDDGRNIHIKLDNTAQGLFQCPFCKQQDFDLISLKNHFIRRYCEIFNDTENI